MLRTAFIGLFALLTTSTALAIEFQIPKKMTCNPDGLWQSNHVNDWEKTELDENLRVIFDRTSGDGFTETATGVSWKTYPSKWVVSYLSNGNNAMHMKSPSPLSDSTSTKWMTVWINGGSMGRYNTASQVGSGVIITRGACDIEW